MLSELHRTFVHRRHPPNFVWIRKIWKMFGNLLKLLCPRKWRTDRQTDRRNFFLLVFSSKAYKQSVDRTGKNLGISFNREKPGNPRKFHLGPEIFYFFVKSTFFCFNFHLRLLALCALGDKFHSCFIFSLKVPILPLYRFSLPVVNDILPIFGCFQNRNVQAWVIVYVLLWNILDTKCLIKVLMIRLSINKTTVTTIFLSVKP